MAKEIEIDDVVDKYFLETKEEVEDGKYKTFDDHPICTSKEEAVETAKALIDNHDHIKTARITKEVVIYKEEED